MQPGKLIGLIGVLILLVLAAEGGYYWGFNRGLKTAPAVSPPVPSPRSDANQDAGRPKEIFSGKDPADVQTTLNVLSLFFKPSVIDHLRGVPPQTIWWSGWSINIGGKLAFLNDKEISLELPPQPGVKTWPLPQSVNYRIYNETTRQTTDASKQEIQPGDTVGFSVDFDTRTGEILTTRITKSVKN